MHATDVNPLFYSALLLSALPVPLLRQVYFFGVFEVLFPCLFSVRFLEGAGRVFWRPFGSFWINFEVGVIFVTFGWIRWISENVSFTVVKH